MVFGKSDEKTVKTEDIRKDLLDRLIKEKGEAHLYEMIEKNKTAGCGYSARIKEGDSPEKIWEKVTCLRFPSYCDYCRNFIRKCSGDKI